MKRKNAISMSELIPLFIKNMNLEEGLNNSKIYNAWDLVVGPKFADATISKFYRDKKLVCKINSPLIKHELIIKRREIARKINQIVGEDAIKELQIF